MEDCKAARPPTPPTNPPPFFIPFLFPFPSVILSFPYSYLPYSPLSSSPFSKPFPVFLSPFPLPSPLPLRSLPAFGSSLAGKDLRGQWKQRSWCSWRDSPASITSCSDLFLTLAYFIDLIYVIRYQTSNVVFISAGTWRNIFIVFNGYVFLYFIWNHYKLYFIMFGYFFYHSGDYLIAFIANPHASRITFVEPSHYKPL